MRHIPRFTWAKRGQTAHAFYEASTGEKAEHSACMAYSRPTRESNWDAFVVSKLPVCETCDEFVKDIMFLVPMAGATR